MVRRQPGVQGEPKRPLHAEVDPLVGHVLVGRFRILGLVARGGMGKIYRAEQIPLGRIVALKVLAPTDRGEEGEGAFRMRFEREASACAKLSHSNTVRIFDYGWTAEGVYYIAMEFLEGSTLHATIRAERTLSELRVIHVVRQVCAALGEAHKLGIVHRDLKPSNVLLTRHGEDQDFVKVVDFGLVKNVHDKEITQAGLIVGSPMYMSPEQVRGEAVDHTTDVYALGMMAYVALTGRKPFERDTPIAAIMARTMHRPPSFAEIAPEVQVSPLLEWVVMTCLATDRRDRFASMHEVTRALKVCEAEIRGDPGGPFRLSVEDGKTVLPPEFSDVAPPRRGTPTPPPLRPPQRSTRLPVFAAAIAAGASLVFGVFLIGGAGWLLWGFPTDSPPENGPTPTLGDGEVVVVSAPPAPAPAPPPPLSPAPPPEAVASVPPRRRAPVSALEVASPDPPAATAVEATGSADAIPEEPAVSAAGAPAPELPDQAQEPGWKVRSEIRNPFEEE
jgi:serine/threonine-protein kinase